MRVAHPQNHFIPAQFEVTNVEAINALVVAGIASIASFLNRRPGSDGKPPKRSKYELAAHLSASAIAALLSRAIAQELGVKSENVLIVLAGISGWASTEGVNWIVEVAKAKALQFTGLDKAKIRTRDAERYTEDLDDEPRMSVRRKKPSVAKDSENIPND